MKWQDREATAETDAPEWEVHCDLPASRKVDVIVVTDHPDESYATCRKMAEALEWLESREIFQATLIADNYRWRMQKESTIKQR